MVGLERKDEREEKKVNQSDPFVFWTRLRKDIPPKKGWIKVGTPYLNEIPVVPAPP
jgi:hypothetical protein